MRVRMHHRLFTTSRRHLHTKPIVIGLRQEDPARIWERRCPLSPANVQRILQTYNADSSGKERVKVLVQPCERRIWGTREFLEAGAHSHPTLEPAHIILGIKEPPLHSLKDTVLPLPSPLDHKPRRRTHLMFSHTTKGQPYNMGLLASFLHEKGEGRADRMALLPRLIDHELLTDARGKRTVGFGFYAGVAGAVESLAAMAQLHLELGVGSPFLHTPRPYTSPNIEHLRAQLRGVGQEVRAGGTPASLGPCVICVTGTGNVAQGALSILQELPIVKIVVDDLPALVGNPDTDLRNIYLLHAHSKDYFQRRDDQGYSRDDYYAHPTTYESVFHTKIAPYITLLLNGAGWAPGFPRLMTNEQLDAALSFAKNLGKGRFGSVGDISCDVGGGLEFLTHSTTLSEPFYRGRGGVQMMAVDILPTTLPLDASNHFSNALYPYLDTVIQSYLNPGNALAETEEGQALERATIAQDGELVGRHAWLEAEVEKWRESESRLPGTSSAVPASGVGVGERKKRVLMLGSGMVAGPAIDELCKRSDIQLVVASNALREAQNLTREYDNASVVEVDLGPAGLSKVRALVGDADLVISLLPVPLHPTVADICIAQGKHMVTASYISPAMRELEERAVSADVLLLNEIGLDPGIDHCSATALIARLRSEGKRIVAFTSFCGGLPSPDSLHGDGTGLRYKFSWSPRGVLGAALNGASFKLGGMDHNIPGTRILKQHFPQVPVPGDASVLKLEGLANRDSLSYAGTYELGSVGGLRTLLRGTLRYPGFCSLMHSFKQVGLLEPSAPVQLDSWSSLARLAMEKKMVMRIPSDQASVFAAIHDLVPAERVDALIDALLWLGIVPGSHPMPSPSLPRRIPETNLPPIDLFAVVLAQKLKYSPGEQDMVILSHEIVGEALSCSSVADAQTVYTSSLVTYGTPRASAMARSVGLPVAFAAELVLDGKVRMRGVRGPSEEDSVFRGVLHGLESVGLGMQEGVVKVGMEHALVQGLDCTGYGRSHNMWDDERQVV